MPWGVRIHGHFAAACFHPYEYCLEYFGGVRIDGCSFPPPQSRWWCADFGFIIGFVYLTWPEMGEIVFFRTVVTPEKVTLGECMANSDFADRQVCRVTYRIRRVVCGRSHKTVTSANNSVHVWHGCLGYGKLVHACTYPSVAW